MKRMLLLPIILFAFCSCASKVESYLKENGQNIASLEIIEENETDSVYSPNSELISMSLIYSELYLKMNQFSTEAWKAKSKKESIQCFNNAICEYDKISNDYDSIFREYCLILDFPELKRPNSNRKAIKAKYKINEKLIEQLFYLNKDGETVGHSESDNKRIAFNLMDERRKVDEIKREIEEEKSDMECNRTFSRAWN